MRKHLTLVALALLCVMAASPVYSQMTSGGQAETASSPAPASSQGPGYQMAASAGMMGFSAYGANFEYLMKGYHGVVGEFGLLPLKNGGMGIQAGAAYRLHFSGKMESYFLGVFVRYFSLSSKSTENLASGGTGEVKYDLTAVSYGLNLGKRWVLPFGVGFTARLGYGPTSSTVKYTGQAPLDKAFAEAIYNLILGLDAELSLCYAF